MIGEIRSMHYSESGDQKIRMQDTRNQDIRKTKGNLYPRYSDIPIPPPDDLMS